MLWQTLTFDELGPHTITSISWTHTFLRQLIGADQARSYLEVLLIRFVIFK